MRQAVPAGTVVDMSSADTASPRPSSTPATATETLAQRPRPDSESRAAGAPAALWAILFALALWAAKATSIAVSGADATLASILFVAGLAAFLVAVGALAAAVTRGRALWLRVLVGVCAIALGAAISLALNALILGVRDPEAGAHWVWGELNLWVVGVAVLALTLLLHRRVRRVTGTT